MLLNNNFGTVTEIMLVVCCPRHGTGTREFKVKIGDGSQLNIPVHCGDPFGCLTPAFGYKRQTGSGPGCIADLRKAVER